VIKHIDYGPLFAAIAGIYLLSALSWLLVDCRQRLD
jgi:drug/metabolite transporter superfamily protein YnfA